MELHYFSNLLEEQPDKTCFVLKNGEVVFDSTHRGVKPLMDYYNLFGASDVPLTIVDRIMGKGAIILAVYIGAKHIVTPIISEIALEFAKINQLQVSYDKVVPHIINRTNDGQCPIERAVSDEMDIEKGYLIIKETLKKLRSIE